MNRLTDWWLDFFQTESGNADWWKRKQNLCNERNASIIRIQGNGQTFQEIRYDNKQIRKYILHLKFLIKQETAIYMEEMLLPFQYNARKSDIADHTIADNLILPRAKTEKITPDEIRGNAERFSYDRLAVVQYAEHWWNSYNPAYKKFEVDCTNYVSQCIRAGGAPMQGMPDRGKGWWYNHNNWSYSWAVAHSLRWYLSSSQNGLRAVEMGQASDLIPGDVICYDFEGDGKWDHNTIVVAKDENNMPLVNAHTYNSRNRYWSYVDSTAWTPNIKYKFFHIDG